VELPLNYFSAVDDTKELTFTGTTDTKAKCALTKAYNTDKDKDLVTCTTSAKILAAGASTMMFPTLSVTLGPAQAASAGKLWTSTDIAFGTTTATTAIGGALGAVYTFATSGTDFSAPLGAKAVGTITFGFTPITAVPIGGKIYVELPLNYFSAVDDTKELTFTGTTDTKAKCALTKAYNTDKDKDLVTCTTSAAILAAGASTMMFPTLSVTLGPPTAAAVGKLWTSTDIAFGTTTATVAIGGQLTAGVAMVITAEQDKVGSNKMNNNTITVGFTVATAVPIGGKIILTLPKDYFLVVDATKTNTLTTTSATCTCVLTKAVLAETHDTVTCTTAGATVAAAAQVLTFVSGSVRIGHSQAADAFNVRTSTDRNWKTPAPATVALGGVLGAGVAIAFATSTDKVPGTVNAGAVTLGFTVINVVPIGGQIVVSLPLNYFSAVDVSKINTLTTTGSTCTCVLAKAATSTTDTVTCTVAGASVAAVAQTLTFIAGSVTAGNPQAASTFTVRTHSNAPADAAGGPVSGPPTTSAKSLASNIVASALLITTSLALALLF